MTLAFLEVDDLLYCALHAEVSQGDADALKFYVLGVAERAVSTAGLEVWVDRSNNRKARTPYVFLLGVCKELFCINARALSAPCRRRSGVGLVVTERKVA